MKPLEMPDRETRILSGRVEIRAAEDEQAPSRKVRGYAAVFGKESKNLGGQKYQFREIIEPGAFDDVLMDDVRALVNHDPNMILARSKAGNGSLTIGTDDTGLFYEFEAPDTRAGNDLLESIRRGDIDQSSFSFSVDDEGQAWEEKQDGDGPVMMTRTIKRVSRLYDVSPVTYPAYPDATVAIRSLEQFRQSEAPPAFENHDLARRQRVQSELEACHT